MLIKNKYLCRWCDEIFYNINDENITFPCCGRKASREDRIQHYPINLRINKATGNVYEVIIDEYLDEYDY